MDAGTYRYNKQPWSQAGSFSWRWYKGGDMQRAAMTWGDMHGTSLHLKDTNKTHRRACTSQTHRRACTPQDGGVSKPSAACVASVSSDTCVCVQGHNLQAMADIQSRSLEPQSDIGNH
jgi:hypothetical protein